MDVFIVSTDSNPASPRTATQVAALAKGLRAHSHRATMITAGTREIDDLGLPLARRLSKVTIELADETFALDLRTGKTPHGLELVVIGSPNEFGDSSSAFDGDDAATAKRLALFGKAAARYVAESDAEAVHGIGIGGALVMAYLPGEDSTAVRVLSIDDAKRIGRFDLEHAPIFGLGADVREATHLALLRAGVLAADAMIVPSTSVGRTIAADPQNPRLGEAIAKHANQVHAIPPGLDGAIWNPLTDPHLASRFDPVDRSGKARCASALCKELGLPIRAGAPVLAVELASDDPSVVESIVEAIRASLRLDATVVVRTTDSPASLDDLAERWTDRLVVRTNFDDAFLHRLLGAADLVLVGNDECPSSALVLAGLRYGALPIVSRAHPMSDRLVDCEASLRTGTAFLSDSLETEPVVGTTRRSLSAFHLGVPFELVRQRAMRIDVSLDRMARLVERLYRTARTESEMQVSAT